MGRDTIDSRYKSAKSRANPNRKRSTANPPKPKLTIRPKGNPLKGVYGFKATVKF